MGTASRGQSEWVRVGCLALVALVIAAYQTAGRAFYDGYRVPQGLGMNHLPPAELAHVALFLLFGGVAALLLFVALRGLPLCGRLEAAARALCARPRRVTLACAVLVLLLCLGLAHFVLGHAVTTDDEHAYRFIARVLRTGALVAPSPGADLEFFREQFIVLTDHVRYGKYPIGHPLLLALGQAVGAEALVVPLLAALVVFPLHVLAGRLFGRTVAGVACLLYAVSPQVWFTGATYLSQPASALALTAGLALMVGTEPEDRASRSRLALAGACFGFGVLVRPLPGVLFAAMAGADLLADRRTPARARLQRAVAFALPLVVLAALVPLVNRAQSGSALVSGYEAFHTPGEGVTSHIGGNGPLWSMSLTSALVRTNVWLFGWPLSLAACLFAGRLPRPWLLWGALGSEVAYRLLAPKAGVGGAGSLYVFEAVPILCMLTAQGLARLARGRTVFGAHTAGDAVVAPALLALTAVALALFVPPKLADLGRMGAGQREVERLLAQKRLHAALVFHEGVVPPWTGLSWAYFPRCNGPGLDDDVLYVRLQRDGGLARNVDFWRRRYPERSAWYFGWDPKTGPFLGDLASARFAEAAPPPGGARP